MNRQLSRNRLYRMVAIIPRYFMRSWKRDDVNIPVRVLLLDTIQKLTPHVGNHPRTSMGSCSTDDVDILGSNNTQYSYYQPQQKPVFYHSDEYISLWWLRFFCSSLQHHYCSCKPNLSRNNTSTKSIKTHLLFESRQNAIRVGCNINLPPKCS